MIRWPIEDVLPHAEDMVLLDHVELFEGDRIVCHRRVRGDELLGDADGALPAWAGVELMAQCVAAWAGCSARQERREVELGFLLGTRQYTCNIDVFPVGTPLRIEAVRAFHDENGMGVFVCRIDAPGMLAEARLTVFSPPNAAAFLHNVEQEHLHV